MHRLLWHSSLSGSAPQLYQVAWLSVSLTHTHTRHDSIITSFTVIHCQGEHLIQSPCCFVLHLRSTELDSNWNWFQLRCMQVGGNANAVRQYDNIPLYIDVEQHTTLNRTCSGSDSLPSCLCPPGEDGLLPPAWLLHQ